MNKHLPTSIQTLISLIDQVPEMTNSILKEILIKSNIKNEDIEQFATYDHPENESYGRKLVHDGGKYKIMVNTWNPGDFSGIHSHGYLEWGIIKYFGEGQQNLYLHEGDTLSIDSVRIMTNGSYEELTNGTIHQNGNNSETPYLSFHIYGSNSRTNNITENSEVFEPFKKQVSITNGSAFLHIPAYLTIKVAELPYIDKETFMYNAILLLKFFNKQKDPSYKEKMEKLLELMSEYYN